jgi:Na+-transporting NADH:ubiquinone oxidoreductase subunit C
MVIVVAAILSSAAMLLKPIQERNMAIAKMQGILAATEITATTDNAQELYAKYITEELVIDEKGNVVSIYKDQKFEKGDLRAFDLDLKTELFKKSQGEPFLSPLYIAHIDDQLFCNILCV